MTIETVPSRRSTLAEWRPPWALPAPLDVITQLGDFVQTSVL